MSQDEVREYLSTLFDEVRQLGTGGSSAVYRARDRDRDRPVAVKVLSREAAASPGAVPRFLREVRLLDGWEHPNIIEVLDYQVEPYLWYSMELLAGFTLTEHLERLGRLTVHETLRLGRGLARALEFVHDHGYVHRDLKPGNVMIDEEGRARLADFGLATQPSLVSSGPGEKVGTLFYMPPEALAHGRYAYSGDLYSLGLIMVECLCGECFMELVADARIRRPRGPLGQVLPAHIPGDLQRLLSRLLIEDPDFRELEAWEVLDELREMAAQVAPPRPIEALQELVTLDLDTMAPLLETLRLLTRVGMAERRAFLGDPERFRDLRLQLWEVARRSQRFEGLDDDTSVAGVDAWNQRALRLLEHARGFLEIPEPAGIERLAELADDAAETLREHLAWARLNPLKSCLEPLAESLGETMMLMLPDEEAPLYCYGNNRVQAERVRATLEKVLLEVGPRGKGTMIMIDHRCEGDQWVVDIKAPHFSPDPEAVRPLAEEGGATLDEGEYSGLSLRWPGLIDAEEELAAYAMEPR